MKCTDNFNQKKVQIYPKNSICTFPFPQLLVSCLIYLSLGFLRQKSNNCILTTIDIWSLGVGKLDRLFEIDKIVRIEIFTILFFI